VPNVRLVFYFHLLWTGVMAGLALLLSLRFPYPETNRWFRITMGLLVLCALAVLPLLWAATFALIWLPASAFLVATIAFVIFSVQVIRSHYQRLVDKPRLPTDGQR